MSNEFRSVRSSDPWWRQSPDSVRTARRVALAFARRDLHLRYVQTRLGGLWAVAQPVILIASLTLVLGRVFGLPDEGLRQFGLNMAAALPGWIWFQYTVSQGATSLVHQQAILLKSPIPPSALPASKALVGLVDFLVASVVVGVGLVILGAASPWALVRIPLIAGFTAMAGLGWAYLIAAWSVRRRDILSVLPVLLQALFFVSPVVLPSANFAAKGWGLLYWLNPAVALSDGFRWAWLDWDVWQPAHALSFASGLLVFLLGTFSLRWRSRRLNEFL